MSPSSDNDRGIAAVKSVLDSKTYLSPRTHYIIEALEIFLTNRKSTFAG